MINQNAPEVKWRPMVEHISDKVLLVDDSKSIRLALKASLESVCGVEVLVAETYREAEELLSFYGSTLFLAILDLALPDAMNGEIVDHAAELGVPILVFTSTFDAKVREVILAKGIIDYVVKGKHSVEEVVQFVHRLQLNRQIRLLVVDDSRSAREAMQSSLARFMFQVFTAENGLEALNVLDREKNIDLILTDYEMPFIDGVELTSRIRSAFSKEDMVIVGVSSTQDDSLVARFLKNGANDFMRKPLGQEEFCHRILHHIDTIMQVRQTRELVRRLAESEERERELVEQGPIGIFRSTPQGRFLSANARLAEMYGYESSQDLIMSIQNIATQLYVDPVEREMVHKAMEQGAIEMVEVRRKRKDGSIIWVALSMRAVKDKNGHILYYEGFSSDITKQKQAENSLKDNESFQRLVLDSIDAGVLVIDPQSHTVESANNAAAKMFGAPIEDIIGQVCHKFLCPAEVGKCPITDLGQEVDHSERILLRADGGSVHILKSAKFFRARGIEKLLGTFVDISERKKAEAMRDHIERIIRHDLRTPVSNAVNISRLLREDGNLTKDQLELLDDLEETSHRMLDLLNSSLELYRIESNQYQIQPEPVDCVDLLRTMIDMILKTSKLDDIRLELLSEGLPMAADFRCMCMGKYSLLQSVMQNLLQNALEASPPGASVVVDLSADKDCRIEIMNTGAVPLEVRETFFDKYVTSGKFKGTGLGTYSARMITRALGGDITMRTSDEVNSTIVTVKLPSA